MKQHFWLKLTISIIGLGLIAARLIWPHINIDAIILGLLAVAILPWLSSLIESAKFPGGWEVKFRDVQAAGQKVTAESPASEMKALDRPAPYLSVSEQDPNLALVGLRIQIEERLRALAERYDVKEHRSLLRLFQELRNQGVLNDASMSGLQEIVMAGNQAAHGAKVEPAVAQWAFTYGPQILAALDSKLDS